MLIVFLVGVGGLFSQVNYNAKVFLVVSGELSFQVNYNANSFLSGGREAFFPSELQC